MELLPNYSTIQKPNYRQFYELSMAGFADAMRPDKFTGVSFNRWQVKCQLWLMAMKIFHVSKGMPEGTCCCIKMSWVVPQAKAELQLVAVFPHLTNRGLSNQ